MGTALKNKFTHHSKPLANENSGSSIAAEFRAAALALENTGPHVTLHCDCAAVIKFLQRGIKPRANRGTPEQQKYMDHVAQQLRKATNNKTIIIVPGRRKKSDQTKINKAHDLANHASDIALGLQ